MSRNGSGTYDPVVTGGAYPAVSGTLIESAKFNTLIADVASALSESLAKDGQTTPTANLPMGGYTLTGLGNGTTRSSSVSLAQLQDSTVHWCGTAGGTANALTLSPTPAITAYAAGQVFRFKSGASANTGAATVAISGLAAITLQRDGAALASGDIVASKWYEILLSDATTAQIHQIGADVANPSFSGVASFNYLANRTIFQAGAGAEGGELVLEKPSSGTSLTENVSIDVSGNSVRIFQNDVNANGASIDLTTCANSIGSAIFHSGIAATKAQQETASSNAVPVTPGNQHHHPSAAKAWARFGVSGNIALSYNVTSVTDTGVGVATVNFATAFSAANYAPGISIDSAASSQFADFSGQATTNIVITAQVGGVNTDPSLYYFTAHGDQ